MTLTGENEVLGEKQRLSVPHSLPQIWHGQIWDRTVTSAVRRGDYPPEPLHGLLGENHLELHINIQSVSRSKHTSSQL